MKLINILFILNVLSIQLSFSQDISRENKYFNDTLKGKWILQKKCNSINCDTVVKNEEYLIFKSISSENYVKFETNGSWCTSKGDSARLYLKFGYYWKIEDFLIIDLPESELSIVKESFDELTLHTIQAGGASNSYIRDKTYTNIQNIKSKLIRFYPNPFVDNLNFSYSSSVLNESISVCIYSSSGLLVKKIDNLKNELSTYTLYLNDLKKGLYFGVLIIDGESINCIRLIKE
ncbi:MAG: T9SS type A sorting domain-containing protein [Nitrosarchaeum sp.]